MRRPLHTQTLLQFDKFAEARRRKDPDLSSAPGEDRFLNVVDAKPSPAA